MSEWLQQARDATWRVILKALTLDDGPDTTRAVVLTVNVAVCAGFMAMVATLCVMCLRRDAAINLGVIGVLAGVITGALTALLGFAQWMQRNRDALHAQASASQTLATETCADGSSSVVAQKQG